MYMNSPLLRGALLFGTSHKNNGQFFCLDTASCPWRVLVFTLALSLLTGVLLGLLPGLQATRPDLIPALKNESTLGGYRRSRLRNVLVVAQMSLSLVLLLCAGRSWHCEGWNRFRGGFEPTPQKNQISVEAPNSEQAGVVRTLVCP